jgi:putative hydrolase of the HAD superfamily
MKNEIDGVAFDLDGTLYPNYRFYIRLVPFLVKDLRLLLALGKARDILRAEAAKDPGGPNAQPAPGYPDFYHLQSERMAELLKSDPAHIKARTEASIYRGWEPLFKKVKAYPHVRETLDALREGGFKLGLLSDFPPKTKLENMGLAGFWDAVLCSEDSGRLKPDPAPFLMLADRMNVRPERLLYVGNSVSYDIIGAKAAGMRAALIRPGAFWKRNAPTGNADLVFSDYRQLQHFMVR